jgi:hypothetical protein
MPLTNKFSAFYIHGFRSKDLGRTLWKIIFLKLFIIFAVLKVFFFPNYLASNFDDDAARAGHVLRNITGGPTAR